MCDTNESFGPSHHSRPSRGHWKPYEDRKLITLVSLHGPHNWNMIAEELKGRSGMVSIAN